MTNHQKIPSFLILAILALTGLAVAPSARAGDVYWSIGLSSPGVQVGVANGVLVVPQPIYSQPYPVYGPAYSLYPSRPIVYVQPGPIIYRPQPRYIESGWQPPGRGWGWRHRRGHHDDDRFDSGRSGHQDRDHRRD